MLSLTATQLPRFMVCNGSQWLGGLTTEFQENKTTDEGNAVHWLIQEVFEGRFKAEELIDRKAPNGIYITPEMVEHSEPYLKEICGRGAVEVNTSYSDTTYEVRGRADHINRHNDCLFIDDFKYGWKIVEPEKNWTLISHAIGYLSRNGSGGIDVICFRIFQPRPYHPNGSVRCWTISSEELWRYWQELRAALTNPSNMLQTSSHCYKCPSRSQCPAHQIASMNAIDVAHQAFDSNVDNDQLSWMLDNIAKAQDVLRQAEDAYQELAMYRIKQGQSVPEYSINTVKGHRVWNDGMTPDLVEMLTGVDCSKKELITPTQAIKKGITEEVINSLSDRPSRGFKLVRMDINKKAEKILGKKGK